MARKKIKGIWFFGYSGAGKTFASVYIAKKIKNSFVIDGDIVRKNISFDLGYHIEDRIVQTKRVLGLAKMCIDQGYFPIISTSYLGLKICNLAKRKKILIVNILRDKKFLYKKKVLKNNVVGKEIKLENQRCIKIDNDKTFKKKIDLLIKKCF